MEAVNLSWVSLPSVPWRWVCGIVSCWVDAVVSRLELQLAGTGGSRTQERFTSNLEDNAPSGDEEQTNVEE